MTTVEMLLRGFLEHPRRGLFVIIVTCVVGLLTVWPVVDEYFVLADDRSQAELSIAEAQQEIGEIDGLRKAAEEQEKTVKELREQLLEVDDVHNFSSKLVELTRTAGCQLRRVDIGEVQKRKWIENDHPLHPAATNTQTKETPYELRTQKMGLSITGPMDRIQSLLGELHAIKKLVHTQSIQLKPATDDRSEVNLDLELLFFDLKRLRKTAPPTT
jgi:hypothetical protein